MAYIVVATTNEHKVQEYRELLQGEKVELRSLRDYPAFPGVEEDGSTFRENASIKALAACRYCDVPAFADDSGLEVEALNGEPGIYSARYAADDGARRAKLLEALKGQSNRRARFVCAIAIAVNGEVIETFEGEVKGVIAEEARGTNGFGYDPLFIPDGCDKTFGELDAETKNRISHRADAFRKAREFVDDQMSILDDDF